MKKHHFHKLYALSSTLYTKGFTLIEILIFTTLISVFFIVAAAVSAFSLNAIKTNENRLYATHYAEEAIEWLKNTKTTDDWTTFSTVRSSGSGRIWCINSSTLSWTSAVAGACSGSTQYSLGSRFSRQTTLQTDAGNNVNSTVTVSWRGYNNTVQTVTLKTVFAQFE